MIFEEQRTHLRAVAYFGATGDLATRKLLPGLHHLARAGLMPDDYQIVGLAPAQVALSTEALRQHARDAVQKFGLVPTTGPAWDAFTTKLPFGAADRENPKSLLSAVRAAERSIGPPCHTGIRRCVDPRTRRGPLTIASD